MRRHELDLMSLVAGLVLLAISVAFLVGALTDTRVEAAVVLPLTLVGLGAAGIAGSLRKVRTKPAVDHDRVRRLEAELLDSPGQADER